MSTSTEVAGLAVEIQLDQVLTELRRIGSATDDAGKDMVAALSKRVKQAEVALKKSAKDAEKSGNALDKFGNAAGKAGSSVQKLAGFLELAPGPMSALARGGADLADVFEVGAAAGQAFGVGLKVVLGVAIPLALAVGAGALAWDYYADRTEKAAIALKKEHEATEATLTIQRKVVDATLKLANLKGEISDREYAQLSAAQSADQVFAAKKLALIETITAESSAVEAATATIEAHKARIEGAAEAAGDMGRQAGGMAAKVATSQRAIAEASTAADEHRTTLGRLSEELGQLVRDEGSYTAILVDTEKQTKANTNAEDARKKAIDQLNAGLEAVLARHARYRTLLEQLRDIGVKSELDRLTGIEKVIAARDQEIGKARELLRLAKAEAGGDEDRRLAAEAAFLDAKTGLEAAALAEIDRLRADAAKKEADRRQKMTDGSIAQVNQIGGYVVDGLSMVSQAHEDSYQLAADGVSRLETQLAASEQYLTSAQKKALEKRIAAQKDAAEEQFEAAKGAKVAEAIASTALAGINAIAQSPPPSPFGLIGAGIAVGAGVAAVAEIESQEFTAYKGGLAPDEIAATLHRNEAVMSQQGRAALGDDAINDANAGVSAKPAPVEVIFKYRHKQYDGAIADTVHRGGRLQREVSSRTRTGPTGHRTR